MMRLVAVVGIIHKKPAEGGISAVGGTGSIYTYYGADEPKFQNLTKNFLSIDLPKVMPALDLADEPVPLWRTRSGSWVSSTAPAWASPSACLLTARTTPRMP